MHTITTVTVLGVYRGQNFSEKCQNGVYREHVSEKKNIFTRILMVKYDFKASLSETTIKKCASESLFNSATVDKNNKRGGRLRQICRSFFCLI